MAEYVTHRREDGAYQPLKAHLTGVAERAEALAAAFGAGEHAYRTGLLHDIGKYSANGQRRQRDPEHMPKADHATAGAQQASAGKDLCAAFAIAGHHGGLPDLGSRGSTEDGTLRARLNKPLTDGDDPSAWREEVELPDAAPPVWLRESPFASPFYTRMLFSCLVDADYLDTEAFMQDNVERSAGEPLSLLLEKLRARVAPWLAEPKTPLCQARNRILSRCLAGGNDAPGLYTLTVPTGGGKTLSSLAFALSHAVAHGLERVIYVIPYTSIIEQNAEVFREALGGANVLEHYANAEPAEDAADADEAAARRKRLAAENWDAPVVVTTAVQFFESLFAAKPSRCRKLHNIARSVVIFDEAQTLPVPYGRPCVHAIAELTRHYGVTAVICTATQPSLDKLFDEASPGLRAAELCPALDDEATVFRRVTFRREDALTEEELARRLSGEHQVLCVVNLRRRARNVFKLLEGEGCYHLSTSMTPRHRSAVLAEIRQRLDAELPCRVISTSLIEAGVDISFPTVWRELAGLDAILQAAGRCNREGRGAADNYVVHIFETDDAPARLFEKNIAATRTVLQSGLSPDDPAAIKRYFDRLNLLVGQQAQDSKDVLRLLNRDLAFRTAAERFHLIEQDTFTVYIPTGENAPLIERLRAGQIDRELLRRLGRDSVGVYRSALKAMPAGTVDICGENYGVLTYAGLYDPKLGLSAEDESVLML